MPSHKQSISKSRSSSVRLQKSAQVFDIIRCEESDTEFFKVPARNFEEHVKRLKGRHAAVTLRMATLKWGFYEGGDGEVILSNNKISKMLGMSRSTARASIAVLIEAGFLKRIEGLTGANGALIGYKVLW